MLRRLLAEDFTVTKRQLGMVLIGVGFLSTGVVLVSFVAGDGLRLVQLFGALGGLVSGVIGLTLLPLGDRPA